MVTVHPQYVVDNDANRTAVLISAAEWESIVEELEELEDIRAYDEAKAGSQEAAPFEQAIHEMETGSMK